MEYQIKAPTVGESITEVRILKWLKGNGDAVKNGEIIVEIETDKASVEVASEATGALKVVAPEGTTVKIGQLIATVDDAQAGNATSTPAQSTSAVAPAKAIPAPAAAASASLGAADFRGDAFQSPGVRRVVAENNIDVSKVTGTGRSGRLTKEDLLKHLSNGGAATPSTPAGAQRATLAPQSSPLPTMQDRPGDRRVQMSRLRTKIAERLVYAQHTAAILTTFNEVDMSAVMEIRNKHKESFKAKHGTALSFMSFFARAALLSLKQIPEVNASIDGTDTVYHDYYDIGIAVGTDRGLVVPVLRNVENMSFADIEKALGALAVKARDGKLSIPEMTGGTFTISNGGTYGSLLSTPILNPPQSGILGMHKIQERPIAVDGKVEIRPMMYLALSYDHRLIDGKGAVTFLVTLRDFLEHPEKLGLDFI